MNSDMKMIKNARISELQQIAAEQSRSNGWWDEKVTIVELCALVHCEVSEAIECYRDRKVDMYYAHDSTPPGKPEGLPSELADVVIRVLDMCGRLNIDLEQAIAEKMIYNTKREYRHGGKAM